MISIIKGMLKNTLIILKILKIKPDLLSEYKEYIAAQTELFSALFEQEKTENRTHR